MCKLYNYYQETTGHINKVKYYVEMFCKACKINVFEHDKTKLEEPERKIFEKVSHNLKKLTYGSKEYFDQLNDIQEALDHHYANNNHHPEHFENGIKGMSLINLVEMLCDWKAASERYDDGDILKSIDIQQKRFNMSDDLVCILKNTVKELNMLKDSETD